MLNRTGWHLNEAIKTDVMDDIAKFICNPEYLVDWPIANNMTAVMVAASEGTIEALQLILDQQPNLNIVDTIGRSALHFACAAGNSENITLLLQHYPYNKDLRTNGGNTPLLLATQSGSIFAMVSCLNFGCNPFLENGLGETPLSAARQFPNVDGANFEEYILQAIESWET